MLFGLWWTEKGTGAPLAWVCVVDVRIYSDINRMGRSLCVGCLSKGPRRVCWPGRGVGITSGRN